MKIVTDNNLLYEDFNEHCKCILTQANGYVFAFVQAVDLGTNPHQQKGGSNKTLLGDVGCREPQSIDGANSSQWWQMAEIARIRKNHEVCCGLFRD